MAGDNSSTGTYVITSNYVAAGRNRTTGVGVSAFEGTATFDNLAVAGAFVWATKITWDD